jgi:hypothetical protein
LNGPSEAAISSLVAAERTSKDTSAEQFCSDSEIESQMLGFDPSRRGGLMDMLKVVLPRLGSRVDLSHELSRMWSPAEPI